MMINDYVFKINDKELYKNIKRVQFRLEKKGELIGTFWMVMREDGVFGIKHDLIESIEWWKEILEVIDGSQEAIRNIFDNLVWEEEV